MSGTTQMAEIKTVVLVHGAFADGSCLNAKSHVDETQVAAR